MIGADDSKVTDRMVRRCVVCGSSLGPFEESERTGATRCKYGVECTERFRKRRRYGFCR